jgi:hypothetical protein
MPRIAESMPRHKVFIPVTDEMLYEHPELITAPLRPYSVNEPCFHWLSVEIESVDPRQLERQDIDYSQQHHRHQHKDAA